MAMPETASMAIIIAGGLHTGRVDGDAARVAAQVRQPLVDRLCAGQTLPTSAPASWPDFSSGLGD
jgi:hypothetical protein